MAITINNPLLLAMALLVSSLVIFQAGYLFRGFDSVLEVTSSKTEFKEVPHVQIEKSNEIKEAEFLRDDYLPPGFPKKPLDVKELAMCDPGGRINTLRDVWVCPSDPSCLKCSSLTVNMFTRLVKAFRFGDMVAQRVNYFKNRFGNRKTVIVISVNYGQLFLLLNWLCSLSLLGLDINDFGLIVPTDVESSALLDRIGIKHLSTDWTRNYQIEKRYTGIATGIQHVQINNVVLLTANELLDAGYNVVLHDVDIVWKVNVLEYLEQTGVYFDIVGMFAPFVGAKYPLNTGLIYLRNTARTKVFMKSTENAAAVKFISDQELFNMVLRSLHFEQVRRQVLPESRFYKYNGRRSQPPSNDMYLYHAVGAHKMGSMKFHHQWLFNISCPYYDKDVDDYSAKNTRNNHS